MRDMNVILSENHKRMVEHIESALLALRGMFASLSDSIERSVESLADSNPESAEVYDSFSDIEGAYAQANHYFSQALRNAMFAMFGLNSAESREVLESAFPDSKEALHFFSNGEPIRYLEFMIRYESESREARVYFGEAKREQVQRFLKNLQDSPIPLQHLEEFAKMYADTFGV
jgi:hypothetical protein